MTASVCCVQLSGKPRFLEPEAYVISGPSLRKDYKHVILVNATEKKIWHVYTLLDPSKILKGAWASEGPKPSR